MKLLLRESWHSFLGIALLFNTILITRENLVMLSQSKLRLIIRLGLRLRLK